MTVEILPGEFRWPRARAGDVMPELLRKASEVGPETEAIVRAHMEKPTEPRLVGDEYVSPHAMPGSEGDGAWQNVRNFIPVLDAMLSDRRVTSNAGFTDARRQLVEQLRHDCESVARNTPFRVVSFGQMSHVTATMHEVVTLMANWKGPHLDDPHQFAQQLEQLERILRNVAYHLTAPMGLAAFSLLARPATEVLRGYQDSLAGVLATQRRNVDEQLALARTEVEGLVANRNEALQILDTVRRASGAKAVEAYKESYEKSANGHGWTSIAWLVGAAALGAAAVGAAIWFLLHEGTVPTSWYEVAFRIGPHIVLVAAPLSAAVWCARMSTMHRRAQIQDRHRLNALSTYVRLQASAPNDGGKLLVLRAVTACVFDKPLPADGGPEPFVVTDIAKTLRES